MITWPIAIAIIGGVASICLTILKMVSMNRDKKALSSDDYEKFAEGNNEAHRELGDILTDAKERLIVLETKFSDHAVNEEGEFEEIKTQINRLTDVIMDVLKKIKMSDDH
jgi:hypothetical protein